MQLREEPDTRLRQSAGKVEDYREVVKSKAAAARIKIAILNQSAFGS